MVICTVSPVLYTAIMSTYKGPGPDELNSIHYPRNAAERLINENIWTDEEAAEYIESQKTRAQIVLQDTVDQARERGLTDMEIEAFIKENILNGTLPRLAEQTDSPEDPGIENVLVIDKFEPEIQGKLEVKLEGNYVRVLLPVSFDLSTNRSILNLVAGLRNNHDNTKKVMINQGGSRHRLLREIVAAVDSRPE